MSVCVCEKECEQKINNGISQGHYYCLVKSVILIDQKDDENGK